MSDNKLLPKIYDIAIVGSGLSGSTLACALSKPELKLNLKIALLDKLPQGKLSGTEEHARALALSFPSIACLSAIGIWQKIDYKDAIRAVHVSSKGHFGVSFLEAKTKGLSELGFVVNANSLNRVLTEMAERLSNVDLIQPAEIVHIEQLRSLERFREVLRDNSRRENPNTHETSENEKLESENPASEGKDYVGWSMTLNTGEIIFAKLIVAADGVDSFIRLAQGIDVVKHDYQHDAIITNVTLSHSHEGIAYERFLKEGCIAMLPFGEKQVKCVWVVQREESLNLMEISDSTFLEKIQTLFGLRLGRMQTISKRVQFPLKSMTAEHVYGQGFVLIGNAANTLHPVGAQGFNLGLRDVATLVDVLKDASDITDIEILKNYAERRRIDHANTRQFTHRLTQSNLGLSFGILACEFISGLKDKIIERGLGRQDSLPMLCRDIT